MQQTAALSYEQSLKAHYAATDLRLRKAPARKSIRAQPDVIASPRPPKVFTSAMPYDHHVKAYYAEKSPLLFFHFIAAQFNSNVTEMRSFFRAKELILYRFEIAYLLKVKFSLSFEKIGEMMNRDHKSIISGIRSHCETHGLEFPRALEPIPSEIVEAIREAYEAGVSMASACAAHEVTPSRITNIGRKQGWYNTKRRVYMDPDAVRADAERGLSPQSIAKKYELSWRTVERFLGSHKIKQGRAHKYEKGAA